MLIVLGITSCKSKKAISDSKDISALSTNRIINRHYHNNFNKRTIYAKLNVRYKDPRTSVNIGIKLRLEKNKTIWMSATKLGIPVAKLKITPTSVRYYEKLHKTYFDGDFSLISQWLGADMDFNKVQNILLGQAVINLKKGKYTSSVENDVYQLKPIDKHKLLKVLFLLNPDNFKLEKQEIRNPDKEQLLAITYQNYQEIKGEQIPKNIYIKAVDNKNTTTLKIEYKTIEFNKVLTFPFNIPDGFKEINLE